MREKTIKIDDFHEYEIEDVKEGGMGRVLILNRLSEDFTDPFIQSLIKYQPRVADKFSLINRKKLAAKTFKDNDFVEKNKAFFEREGYRIIELVQQVHLLRFKHSKRQLSSESGKIRYEKSQHIR